MDYTITQENFDSLVSCWADASHPLRWNSIFVLPTWLKVWWQELGSADELYLSACPALVDISAPSLLAASSISLVNLSTIADFSFPNLAHIGKKLWVAGNPLLTSFSRPNLKSAGLDGQPGHSAISVGSNGSLATLELPSLEIVGGWLSVTDESSIALIVLPAIISVLGRLQAYNNPSLAECILDALVAQLESAAGVGEVVTYGNNEACTCEAIDGQTVATCP